MSAKPKIPNPPALLLRRAERTLGRSSSNPVPATETDARRLLHELEVHQIELETQNAELRLARDEAESLREKYTDLYDFAPVGYFTLAKNGTIRMVNLAGSMLVGLDRSRLVGQAFERFVCPPLRADFMTFFQQIFAGKADSMIEFMLLDKGHPDKAVTINFLLSPDGTECSAVVTDISSHKRDADAVRASEIRYRRLFETAHDGILILNPATRKITDANPFMTKLLGYSHEQLVGKELYEIGLLEDEEANKEMFRKMKKTHEVRYEDLPLESQDGKHHQVEVVANIYQENGEPVIQCNIRDITVRKRAEELLRRNEALFSALIGVAPVGVYVVNARFQLQQTNPLAMKVFKNINPLIGRDFSEIVCILWPKRAAHEVVNHFRHALKTGEAYQSPKFCHRRKDTRVKEVYEWQIERVTLPDGEPGIVCFFNDITERVKVEAAARRLEVLTASNAKLRQEINRREVLEDVLNKSRAEETRLLTQSRRQELRLRDLSHQILHVQEQERKRISRELHDVIAQTLVGINVNVAALARETDAELGSLQERIASTHQMVEKSVELVHQFARELRPTLLDDLGLIPALRTYLKSFMEDTGIRTSLKSFAGIEKSPEIIRTAFYRIVQEALTNVAGHANATAVEISIQSFVGGISLEITDDGEGFEVNENLPTKNKGRLGLIGMRERAEMIGGMFSVASAPGAPTTVRVLVKRIHNTNKTVILKKSVIKPSSKRP